MRSRPIRPVRRQVRLSASAVAGLYLGWRMAKGLLAKLAHPFAVAFGLNTHNWSFWGIFSLSGLLYK